MRLDEGRWKEVLENSVILHGLFNTRQYDYENFYKGHATRAGGSVAIRDHIHTNLYQSRSTDNRNSQLPGKCLEHLEQKRIELLCQRRQIEPH